MTSDLTDEGRVLTTPRGIYINFLNLTGRRIQGAELRTLSDALAEVAAKHLGDNLSVTTSLLVGEKTGKREETLRAADVSDLAGLGGSVRILRSRFTAAATPESSKAAYIALDVDLTQRGNRTATLDMQSGSFDATSDLYRVYEILQNFKRAGMLNGIASTFKALEGNGSMRIASYDKREIQLTF